MSQEVHWTSFNQTPQDYKHVHKSVPYLVVTISFMGKSVLTYLDRYGHIFFFLKMGPLALLIE